jgi:hypothetical protein
MTLATIPAFDPIAEAITAVKGMPEVAQAALPATDGAAKTKDLLIIDYSGDLEKVWAALILASGPGSS